MKLKQYLPSKKIQIILITVVVLAVGYLVYYFLNNQTKTEESSLIDVALIDSNNQDESYYQDTDNDGAYDWEEKLWPELDPNNPDSDGDGVLDGKYLQNKRSIAERERRGATDIVSTLSESEKFARSTATALLAIAQAGGAVEGETQEQFQENIANYITNLTLGDQLYTRDTFTLVPNTKTNTATYRTNMTEIFSQYPVAGSDIDFIIRSVEQPGDSQAKLQNLSVKYREYLERLIGQSVPYAIAGRHTELTNSISQISGALENMVSGDTDDLVSLSLVIQLEKILNDITESITYINEFLDITKDESLFLPEDFE